MDSLPQNTTVYATLMLLAGMGIPTMAALNAGLGSRLQSPSLAASILFLVAMFMALTYMVIVEGLPKTIIARDAPFYFYLGGFFVVFYILTITWVAPRYGIGNAVSFVLLGQLISMTAIDHFGLLGSPQSSLTLQRAVGLLVMALGVFLVVRK